MALLLVVYNSETMASISLKCRYLTPHRKQTIHVKIEYDGTIVHNEIYTIPGQDGSIVHGPIIEEIPESPGNWIIEATAKDFKKRNHIRMDIEKHVNSNCTIPSFGIYEDPSRIGIST